MHPSNNSLREEEALLPGLNNGRRTRQDPPSSVLPMFRHWKPHPYWLIPVVLIMSMSRGVTMSPRIQVYKAIACRSLSEGSTGLSDFVAAAECGGAEVQARAAQIQASVVTIMSGLSAISTGFWSRLGDVHGRKPILFVFFVGALAMEAVFMLVMRPDSIFGRHAEKMILIGPVLEGFVGGISTFNGVVHAYMSDCTRPGSRSKIFSTIQGIVFVGMAMGPWLGGLILPDITYNDGFFLTSIGLIIAVLLFVMFICPESKQPSSQNNEIQARDTLHFKTSPGLVIRRFVVKFSTTLLSPIAMFAPRRVPGYSRRDYNMPLAGLAFFLYCVSTGVYTAKYLYAQHVYTWTTAQLGYYMSTLWISRAFNLLIFLPIAISYLKPHTTSLKGSDPSPADIAAELKFDKYLAQISLAVDGLADSLVALIPGASQTTFTALSCLSSFTSGGNPALHSLSAVCLHACGYGSEVGALFGACAVLSAIAHIVSPGIYAMTYSLTVAHFPQAIFVLAAVLLFAAVFLLAKIHPKEGDILLDHTERMDGAESPSTPLNGYNAVVDSSAWGSDEIPTRK